MSSRTLILGMLLLCGVTVASAAAINFGGGGPRGSRTVADRYLGEVAPRQTVRFGLTLRMRGSALSRYATAVGAGSEPALSAAAIGRRFGVDGRDLEHVRSVLAKAGVRVEIAFPQRTELQVSAPAARVEQLLSVRLGEFAQRSGSATHFHKPLGKPVIPPALRSEIGAVTQLDDEPILLADDVPEGGLGATNLEALYDLRPLIARGLDGSGQTVAVFSEDTFRNSDIAAFDHQHNITEAPAIQRVEVDGNVPYVSGPPAVEVDLDTEEIQELAPRAHILNYEICCGVGGFQPGIDKIVSDGRAKLIWQSVCHP